MLEKKEILEVDRWVELRDVRNKISHEYPYDDCDMIEAINGVLKNIYLAQGLMIKKEVEI